MEEDNRSGASDLSSASTISFVEAEESSATRASTPERDTRYESPGAELSSSEHLVFDEEMSSVGEVYSSEASDFFIVDEGKIFKSKMTNTGSTPGRLESQTIKSGESERVALFTTVVIGKSSFKINKHNFQNERKDH